MGTMRKERIKVNGKEYEFDSYFVQANGQRLHCVEAGKGPLVLLVHGFPEIWYVWRYQMVALAEAGYRVVAFDTRGYGRSSQPQNWADYRITELVEDCVQLVKAVGEENAIIIGHDWGATVAWTAAWLRPDVFKGVAGLANTFGGREIGALPFNSDGKKRPTEIAAEIGGDDKWFYQDYFSYNDTQYAQDQMEPDIRGWLRDGLYSWSGCPPLPEESIGVDFTKLQGEDLRQFLRNAGPSVTKFGNWREEAMGTPEVLPPWLTEEDLDIVAGAFEASGFFGGLSHYRVLDLNWELLGGIEEKITVPALYIGSDRCSATIWSGDAIAKLPQRCTDLRGIVILKDCGHWEQLEKPEEVNAELLKFLSNVVSK